MDAILAELRRRPIAKNEYRDNSGPGRSQCFGVVNKRGMPPDHSRQNWLRPYLFKLLLDYGAEHVTDISWNAIQVNMNYAAAPHRDKGNIGPSYLVAFGDFTGGELQIHEGDLSGCHDVRVPLVTDFSKVLHSVLPFEGERISLVYHYNKRTPPGLPSMSVEMVDGRWEFKRGGEVCRGLPHPLKGRKHPLPPSV